MPEVFQPVASAPAGETGLKPIALGRQLRPIVLGVGGDAALADGGGERFTPRLLLGVHGHDGRLLGYFAAETVDPTSWGGLCIGNLTASDVILLGRRTSAALALVGLRHSVHQGVLISAPGGTAPARGRDLSEYLDALLPLAQLDLGRIAFVEQERGLQPTLACAAASETALALAVRTLAAHRIDLHRATVALYDPSPLASSVGEALRRRGAGVVPAWELAAPADLLLVGTAHWKVGATEASAIRARALLPLGPTHVEPRAAERLGDRGVFVIPEALVLGGALTVLELRARGLSELSARDRAVEVSLAQLDRLLERAPRARRHRV